LDGGQDALLDFAEAAAHWETLLLSVVYRQRLTLDAAGGQVCRAQWKAGPGRGKKTGDKITRLQCGNSTASAARKAVLGPWFEISYYGVGEHEFWMEQLPVSVVDGRVETVAEAPTPPVRPLRLI
jgi:hypothetical protein